MTERERTLIRLDQEKQKLAEEDILADADLNMLRSLIDPYQDDFTLLDTAKIAEVAGRFHKSVSAMREIKGRIARMAEAAGVQA